MERFYDGDQEKLFAEARVVNPFRKGPLINRNQSSQSSLVYKILYHFCSVYVTYKNMICLKLAVQKNFNEWYGRMWDLFYRSTICSTCINK